MLSKDNLSHASGVQSPSLSAYVLASIELTFHESEVRYNQLLKRYKGYLDLPIKHFHKDNLDNMRNLYLRDVLDIFLKKEMQKK